VSPQPSPAAPTVDLELSDPDFVADPYPALSRLRRIGPVVRQKGTGMLLVSTHAEVGAALRDRRLGRIWRDREPAAAYEAFNALHSHQMMENEPPRHTRLRRLVAGAFARGHVQRMRPRVRQLADEMLDAMALRAGTAGVGTPVDLVADYAEPLPVAVIADLLGVPASDRPLLRAWSQAIVRMYEYRRTLAVEQEAVRASTEFADYVRALVAERRRAPGNDLLSDLVEASLDGSRLSEQELIASVVLLLNAGHEASVNTFGNGVVALLRHPAELARVASGKVPVATAVEEMLRHDAALQLFERTATADLRLADVAVPAGSTVAVLLGAANRDPAAFPAPDRFDVGRDPNPHLGFGMGVHFCLGAPLARMELEVAVQRLLARFPALSLVGDPQRRPTFVLRGFSRISVDLGVDLGRAA
jgi:cytochrome P450